MPAEPIVTPAQPAQPVPAAPSVGFVKPVIFPPMKDRLHRTFIRYRASLGMFVLISGVTGLPSIILAAMRGHLPAAPAAGLGIVGFVASLLAPYVLVAVAAGELRFGRAFSRGLGSLLPGIFTTFVFSLVIFLPSLLIVPAVIMAVRFTLTVYVVINERRKGVEALARSRDLIYGRTTTLLFDQLGLAVMGGIIGLAFSGIAAAAAWVTKPALVSPAASAASWLFAALFSPFYLIYLQTFYEDCVAVVGKEWTVKPSRKLFYRILAALGAFCLVGIIALPVFFLTRAKFNLADLTKISVNAPFGERQAREPSAAPVTAPPKYASTPEERDLQRYGDVNMIKLALGSWFSDNKAYPDSLDQLSPRYLKTVPKDPDGPGYGYQKRDLTFVISFTLEQGVLAFAKGPHTLSLNGFDVAPQPTTVPPDEKTVTTTVPAPPSATNVPEQQPSPSNPLPAEAPQTDAAPSADTDGDGVSDEQETMVYNTNPNVADTDLDGLSDGEEIYVYGTDPLKADTDGDGFGDGREVEGGYNPKGPGMLTAEQKAQFDANMQTFRAKR